MPRREQIKKQPKKSEQPIEDIKPAKSDEELKAETEALLDEIDSVLEENAQEFIDNYVQKGGE